LDHRHLMRQYARLWRHTSWPIRLQLDQHQLQLRSQQQ